MPTNGVYQIQSPPTFLVVPVVNFVGNERVRLREWEIGQFIGTRLGLVNRLGMGLWAMSESWYEILWEENRLTFGACEFANESCK